MNNIKKYLRYVPGFRTNTLWKSIVATMYYFMCLTDLVKGNFSDFTRMLSIPFIVLVGISIYKNKNDNSPAKKILLASIAVFASSLILPNLAPEKVEVSSIQVEDASNEEEEDYVDTENNISDESTEVEKEESTNDETQEDSGIQEVQENTFEEATVSSVVDGDTIVIDRGNGDEKLRFILVDTPETVHPSKPVEFYGEEASNYTTEQLSGKTIYLQKDISETDKYDRLLRYIWLTRPSSDEPTEDEIKEGCFNAILLKEGYANTSTFPPDVKYQELFQELEGKAKEENKGLWDKELVEEQEIKAPIEDVAEIQYVGNSNSKKFHYANCSSAKKISSQNRVEIEGRDNAISKGYDPCGICKP